MQADLYSYKIFIIDIFQDSGMFPILMHLGIQLCDKNK